jgi:hypothetical protein
MFDDGSVVDFMREELLFLFTNTFIPHENVVNIMEFSLFALKYNALITPRPKSSIISDNSRRIGGRTLDVRGSKLGNFGAADEALLGSILQDKNIIDSVFSCYWRIVQKRQTTASDQEACNNCFGICVGFADPFYKVHYHFYDLK